VADFDFTTFPVLTTPRLILREITPGDTEDFLAMNSDTEVLKYDVDPPLKNRAEALTIIEDIHQHFLNMESITWGVCLKEENRLIGTMGFYFEGHAYFKADLGYRLARPNWRKGIATEAVRAMMRFAFETLCVHRINVDTRMDNLGSVQLMQKLGFVHEGVRRECGRNEDGSYHSWGLYGMLEEEYRRLLVVEGG
jgi:[ribosomal protein S5]-alanine N-acetyltransferase